MANAYDAMTADRPYRRGNSDAAPLVEIPKCVGTQFDPVLAEIFVEVISQRANAVGLQKKVHKKWCEEDRQGYG